MRCLVRLRRVPVLGLGADGHVMGDHVKLWPPNSSLHVRCRVRIHRCTQVGVLYIVVCLLYGCVSLFVCVLLLSKAPYFNIIARR